MVFIHDKKIEEITDKEKEEYLKNNNTMYLGATLMIKKYMEDHPHPFINQKMIDIACKIMWDHDKYYYEYNGFDELTDMFKDQYKKNYRDLYNIFEYKVDKIRSSDCGFYPYFDHDERRKRVLEIIDYPIDLISKYYFFSVIYEEYYGIHGSYTLSDDRYDLIDDSNLLSENNHNLYEYYYIYHDLCIDDIEEYLSNNQWDDFYNFMGCYYDEKKSNNCYYFHKLLKYMDEVGSCVIEYNNLVEDELIYKKDMFYLLDDLNDLKHDIWYTKKYGY